MESFGTGSCYHIDYAKKNLANVKKLSTSVAARRIYKKEDFKSAWDTIQNKPHKYMSDIVVSFFDKSAGPWNLNKFDSLLSDYCDGKKNNFLELRCKELLENFHIKIYTF